MLPVRNAVKLYFGHSFPACPYSVVFGHLRRADLTALERDEHVAEWVSLADRVAAQLAQKPRGGRPEGGALQSKAEGARSARLPPEFFAREARAGLFCGSYSPLTPSNVTARCFCFVLWGLRTPKACKAQSRRSHSIRRRCRAAQSNAKHRC